MTSDIEDRLLSVVDNLFFAHNSNEASLQEFNKNWSILQDDISKSASTLSPSTADLAFSVSSTVDILCQAMINLHIHANNILTDSEKKWNLLVKSPTKDPGSTPPHTRVSNKKRRHSSTSPDPPTSRKRAKRTAPAEPAPAPASSSFSSSSSSSSSPLPPSPPQKRDYTPLYTWLTDNLHNPYPSAYVRRKLSRASGGADVEQWFTTARRKIGWTGLVKRVAGGRERVVSAAKHYWRGEGEGEEFPAIDVEFALIESNLKDVYGPRLGGPGEVVKLFGVVPSLTSLKRKRDEEESQQSSKRRKQEKPPKAFQLYEPPNLDAWFGDAHAMPEGTVQLEVELPGPYDEPPVVSDLDSYQAVFDMPFTDAFDTPFTDALDNIDYGLHDFDFGAASSWDFLLTSTAFDFNSDLGIAVG